MLQIYIPMSKQIMANMCMVFYQSIQCDIAQIKQWIQCSDDTSVAQSGTKFSLTFDQVFARLTL